MSPDSPPLGTPGPAGEGAAVAPAAEVQTFSQGVERGLELASLARRRVAAWAEENPGQLLLVGLGAGFLLGKLFARPRRRGRDEL